MTVFDYTNNDGNTKLVLCGFVWEYTESENGTKLQFYREAKGPRPEPLNPAYQHTAKPVKAPVHKESVPDVQLMKLSIFLWLLGIDCILGIPCADYLSTTLLHADFGYVWEIVAGGLGGLILIPAAFLTWLWQEVMACGVSSLAAVAIVGAIVIFVGFIGLTTYLIGKEDKM